MTGRQSNRCQRHQWDDDNDGVSAILRGPVATPKDPAASTIPTSLDVFIFVASAFIVIAISHVHGEYHKENACKMTFMYRNIYMAPQELPGPVDSPYTLHRYIEFRGAPDETIGPADIPLLFVPGSGGSSKQVRSVASLMQNKTESRGAPFRYVMYAIDFKEEMSFLSGRTLERQAAFVARCITHILSLHSKFGVNKLVLMGHSFGGTALYLLPTMPQVNLKNIGLVVTLGAPINAPPIAVDRHMETIFNNAHKVWRKRWDELAHIGFVSISGGTKDFLVLDGLTRGQDTQPPQTIYEYISGHKEPNPLNPTYTTDQRIVHFPATSLSDVALEADHACLAWCNQLIRHISRLLWDYGQEWRKGKGVASKVVTDFYRPFAAGPSEEIRSEPLRDTKPLFPSRHVIFIGSPDRRNVTMHRTRPWWAASLVAYAGGVVIDVTARVVECQEGITGEPAQLTWRPFASEYGNALFSNLNETTGIPLLRLHQPRPSMLYFNGTLRVKGTGGCSYEVIATPNWKLSMYTAYLDMYSMVTLLLYLILVPPFFMAVRAVNPLSEWNIFNNNDLPRVLVYGFFGCAFFVAVSFFEHRLLLLVSIGCISRSIVWIVGGIAHFVTSPLNWVVSSLPPLSRFFFRGVVIVLLLLLSVHDANLSFICLLLVYLHRVARWCSWTSTLTIAAVAILTAASVGGGVRENPEGMYTSMLHTIYNDMSLYGILDGITSFHLLLPVFTSLLFAFALDGAATFHEINTQARSTAAGSVCSVIALSLFTSYSMERFVITIGHLLFFHELYRSKVYRKQRRVRTRQE